MMEATHRPPSDPERDGAPHVAPHSSIDSSIDISIDSAQLCAPLPFLVRHPFTRGSAALQLCRTPAVALSRHAGRAV
jgi:hypothetical protein